MENKHLYPRRERIELMGVLWVVVGFVRNTHTTWTSSVKWVRSAAADTPTWNCSCYYLDTQNAHSWTRARQTHIRTLTHIHRNRVSHVRTAKKPEHTPLARTPRRKVLASRSLSPHSTLALIAHFLGLDAHTQNLLLHYIYSVYIHNIDKLYAVVRG